MSNVCVIPSGGFSRFVNNQNWKVTINKVPGTCLPVYFFAKHLFRIGFRNSLICFDLCKLFESQSFMLWKMISLQFIFCHLPLSQSIRLYVNYLLSVTSSFVNRFTDLRKKNAHGKNELMLSVHKGNMKLRTMLSLDFTDPGLLLPSLIYINFTFCRIDNWRTGKTNEINDIIRYEVSVGMQLQRPHT